MLRGTTFKVTSSLAAIQRPGHGKIGRFWNSIYSKAVSKKNVNVICLPTEHQGVHKNSFRNVRAFQDRIGIWKCWFLRRGENRSTRRKTSRNREENQQQPQPTYDAGSGNRTRDTLVGGERSHHYTIPAPRTPSLLPNTIPAPHTIPAPCWTSEFIYLIG